MDPKTISTAAKTKRRARQFRIAGVIVLALGMAGAGLVYWLGTRAADLSADPEMAGFDRPVRQQMGILYGEQGELIEDWSDDLKQPRTQAAIIIIAAGIVAFACFQFARLSDRDAAAE